jgi:hypothetical protein
MNLELSQPRGNLVRKVDPNGEWLQRLLERAVAEGWCTKINCTTCGSDDLRQALGLINVLRAGRDADQAEAIILSLRKCTPSTDVTVECESAVRWILFEVWRKFGDRYFECLPGSWAGDVLGRMQSASQEEA